MNWLQRFAIRLAARIAPPLGRLLRSAGGTVDRLVDQNEMLRRMLDDRRALWESEAQDLREAIQLASGGMPWKSPSTAMLPATASESARAAVSESGAVVVLKERLAELELALEDRGWKRQLAMATTEFSRYGIQQIILISRLYFIKNPLIRRGVQISAYYVFGRGVEISSADTPANKVLDAFFNDPRNASEISHVGLVEKDEALQTDGNLFWALFTSVDDGAVIVRSIDPTEIEEVICDPEDAAVAWYYHRRYFEMVFDVRSGVTTPKPQECWYVALGFEPPAGLQQIGGKPLIKDPQTGTFVPIMHVKDGALPKWRFGCPPVYGAIDWARAYRHGLEDYCSMKRALSRFAWGVETQGGIPAIAAWKQTLATTLANDESSIEQNPPPVVGSALITGPGNKVTPFKVAGLQDSPEELRRVLLMVCAHFGLPETFFGDASTGSLATAVSLDRPTELKFRQRQEKWKVILKTLACYVLNQSGMAVNGILRASFKLTVEDTELCVSEAVKKKSAAIHVKVVFPSVLEHDIASMIEAIVNAATMNGFEVTGIDEKAAVKMMFEELGFEDVDEIVEKMYPKAEYDLDRTAELNNAKELALNPPAAPPAPGPQPPTQDPAQQQGAPPVPEKQRTPRAHKTNPQAPPAAKESQARLLAEMRRLLIEVRAGRAKLTK